MFAAVVHLFLLIEGQAIDVVWNSDYVDCLINRRFWDPSPYNNRSICVDDDLITGRAYTSHRDKASVVVSDTHITIIYNDGTQDQWKR